MEEFFAKENSSHVWYVRYLLWNFMSYSGSVRFLNKKNSQTHKVQEADLIKR